MFRKYNSAAIPRPIPSPPLLMKAEIPKQIAATSICRTKYARNKSAKIFASGISPTKNADNTATPMTTTFSTAICKNTEQSFCTTIFPRLTGCVSKNSAVCSFSSFASAEMPKRAAKKEPPSPSTFPHSTPK